MKLLRKYQKAWVALTSGSRIECAPSQKLLSSLAKNLVLFCFVDNPQELESNTQRASDASSFLVVLSACSKQFIGF